MTIWILAILLLASEVGLGLRQGAIRAACSFIGIMLGALLANPLGHLLERTAASVGIKHPLVQWLLPPLIVFAVVVVIFKAAGYAAHRKVGVLYKYKAGDLRLALWQRLNSRLGMCVALANGAAYLVLISFVLYIASYWSVQLATAPANPRGLRILNRMGKDLQSTGMAEVGRSIDRMPALYYETADVAGLLYNNPSLKERLYEYPLFIGLAEQPDFEGLVNSSELAQAWQDQAPITQIIKSPSVDGLLKNPELLLTFWGLVRPDLNDLTTYLTTGQSPRFGAEKILGRWNFDVNGTIGLLRRSRPTIPSKEMARVKNWIAQEFARMTFVVMPDHKSILKNFPHAKATPGAPPSTELLNVPGRWKNADGQYVLSYSPEGRVEEVGVTVDGDRLVIASQGLELAFERQD
jgi:hypothetical protein